MTSKQPSQNWLGDPGVVFLLIILIVVFVWFFGFRSQLSDVPISPADISNAITATPTDLPTELGYFNSNGLYALNYPSEWQGTEGNDAVQFLLPEGAMVYVYVDSQITDFDSFKSNSALFSVIMTEVETEIGGVPAQCVELSKPESQIKSSIACFIPKNSKGYIVSVAELEGLSESDRKIVQGEFMDLLLSFRFLE